METKANYLAVGAFAILGFLGLLGFVAWFSKAEMSRSYAYYHVYFDNVSGLGPASPVKFAGLAVGQVVDLELSEKGDGRVRVRLEVDPATPVREGSIAKVEAQGVTGVSFVGITSGDPEAALLTQDGAVPEITAGRSSLQTLAQDAPRIAEEALRALEQINALTRTENQLLVGEILQNLADSSHHFDVTLSEFSMVAENVGASVSEIAGFTTQLDDLSLSVERTLEVADTALASIDSFAIKATETLDAGTQMLTSADDTVTMAGAFIDNELAALVTDVTVTSASLRGEAETLTAEANDAMRSWELVGNAAQARLAEAEALFAETLGAITDLRATLVSMEASSDSFNALMEGDGAALVHETRSAMKSASRALAPLARAAEEDLPGILEDLRTGIEGFDLTIAEINAAIADEETGLAAISAQTLSGISAAEATFTRARQSMAAIDHALARAETTLGAAEGAFQGAERIVNQDIGPITRELSGALDRLNTALDQINADIPAISTSLRSAAERANATAGRIGAMTREIEGPVARFANEGLTRYTNVAREAEILLRLLESIATRIERNPSRFLLGGETPTYRR